jgi:hypothetical protein
MPRTATITVFSGSRIDFGGALGQLARRERNADRLGQRDRHLSPRLRLSYIPLAHPIAVCSLCQIDVNVIGMMGI